MKKIINFIICMITLFAFAFNVQDSNVNNENVNNSSSIIKKEKKLFSDDSNDVINELNSMINEYQTKLLTDENNESIKLQIDALTKLKEKELANNNYSTCDNNGGNITISSIITGFNILNYKLAAELLTFSTRPETNDDTHYKPVYGSRVLSSPIIYNIAKTSSTIGSGIFEKKIVKNGYDSDLYYSIKKFDYTKDYANSTLIHITDRYDFEYENDNKEYEQKIINYVFECEKRGEISYYYVDIDIDVGNAYKVEVLEKNDLTKKIKVKIENTTNDNKLTMYTLNTCGQENAENWSAIPEFGYCILKPYSNIIIEINIKTSIEGNLLHFFAVSSLFYNKRYITVCDGIEPCSLSNEYRSISEYFNYGSVELIAKTREKYAFKVQNVYDEEMLLEYNSKIVSNSDAKGWKNLTDIKAKKLMVDAFDIIEIAKVSSKTDAAIRLINDYIEHRFYLSDFKNTGEMNFGQDDYQVYKHLIPSIEKKDGNKWYITITNTFSQKIVIYYNSKMCNENDAQNWTGLNDIKTINVNANSEAHVIIQENWFATCITMSYVINNERVITYANKLDANKSINIMYNVKKA